MSDTVKCKICGCDKNATEYNVRERQINRGDRFTYYKCSHCGTLQIYDAPNNMEDYYPANYYAFRLNFKRNKLSKIVRCIVKRFVIDSDFKLSYPLQIFLRKNMISAMMLYGTKVSLGCKILDVGGGNGDWLYRLRDWGFYNRLVCVDRFCEKTSENKENIEFIQADILDVNMDEKFDLITLHHSFEHMNNPDNVLKKIRSLIDDDGMILIRIPVCDSEAFDEYGINWFQIDAPRHYYLYTSEAMKILCERNGLEIVYGFSDSLPTQFFISEKYRDTDLSLRQIQESSGGGDWRKYFWKTAKVNKIKRGDQMAFYIKKK